MLIGNQSIIVCETGTVSLKRDTYISNLMQRWKKINSYVKPKIIKYLLLDF